MSLGTFKSTLDILQKQQEPDRRLLLFLMDETSLDAQHSVLIYCDLDVR